MNNLDLDLDLDLDKNKIVEISKEDNKINVLCILPIESNYKIKKHIFLYKKGDNNYIRKIIKKINNKYEQENGIIKYLLNFNLNLSAENLEEIYNNNISIFNNDYNIYDLNIIRNLNNNNNNINDEYYNETNSLIFIIEKKEKVYYIKNRKYYNKTKNFNKYNNTKKVRNIN